MGKRSSLKSLVTTEYKKLQEERHRPSYPLAVFESNQSANFPYPIDMSLLLDLPYGELDANGVPFNSRNGAFGGVYQPTSIAQYALAQWNTHLIDHDPARRESFLIQARWLMAHETPMKNGTGMWPIPYPVTRYGASSAWFSALTQGNILSVLARAYKITGETEFLECARRCARSFQFDILDGGVAAPSANGGIFFEEVCTYPAARILNGYVLAVYGLYDYLMVDENPQIRRLADWSVETLHEYLPDYDLGYWSGYDLLYQRASPRFYHLLHAALMQGLAYYTGCQHCIAVGDRWFAYERPRMRRVRYYISSRLDRYRTRITLKKPSFQRQSRDPKARARIRLTGEDIAGGVFMRPTVDNHTLDAEWRDMQGRRQSARARAGIRPDALVVTMLCHAIDEKAFEVALKAIERARASIAPPLASRLQVLVIGRRAPARALQRMARASELGDAIQFQREESDTGIAEQLARGDVFLYTGAPGENFWGSVPLAMEAGCAVVANAPRWSARMPLEDGRGIAIPSGNINALGSAVAYLLGDPEARSQMSARGWRYRRERRSPESLMRSKRRLDGWIPVVDEYIAK